MTRKSGGDIAQEYLLKFGEELPAIPMFQCSGFDDPKYLEMLKNAIERGSPVNEKDYETYFPIEKDVLY